MDSRQHFENDHRNGELSGFSPCAGVWLSPAAPVGFLFTSNTRPNGCFQCVAASTQLSSQACRHPRYRPIIMLGCVRDLPSLCCCQLGYPAAWGGRGKNGRKGGVEEKGWRCRGWEREGGRRGEIAVAIINGCYHSRGQRPNLPTRYFLRVTCPMPGTKIWYPPMAPLCHIRH
eukprot:391-Rhodomonas_salina.1